MLVLVPLLVACVGLEDKAGPVGRDGNAACEGPSLSDQPPDGRHDAPPPTVRPGTTIEIYGHGYTSTCNDTGGHDPLEPLPDVELTLTLPGGKTQSLGRHSPGGPDLGFKAVIRIPSGTRTGTAMISDDRRPYPATFRFQIGRS